MGLFAVSPNTALPSLILVLLPWRETISEYSEPTNESYIEMKNEKIVSQNPFTSTLVPLPKALAVTYFCR